MEDKKEKCRIWGAYKNMFQVRSAQYSDLKGVYQMIIELAEDLKANVSEDVKSSEDQFLSDFQNEYFHLIVVEKLNHDMLIEEADVDDKDDERSRHHHLNGSDDKSKCENNASLIGYALYLFGYETWTGRVLRLDDIYVKQSYRKIGIGTYLMAILAKISFENNCKSLKWQCLDTNTKGLKFYYEKLKATEEVMETNGKQSKLVNIEMDEEDMKNLSLQVLK